MNDPMASNTSSHHETGTAQPQSRLAAEILAAAEPVASPCCAADDPIHAALDAIQRRAQDHCEHNGDRTWHVAGRPLSRLAGREPEPRAIIDLRAQRLPPPGVGNVPAHGLLDALEIRDAHDPHVGHGLGPIPVDRDVMLNPMAFAGWSGLFVTALNLLPVGQLDGGHVAYALLGTRQNRIARGIHWSLLVVFAYNLVRFLSPVIRTRRWADAGQAVSNSVFWLMWFGLLHLIARASGRNHPPTDPGELSPGRKVVAVVTLILFVLLFMPTPWAVY